MTDPAQTVTIIVRDDRDPYAESPWKVLEVPYMLGASTKHYLRNSSLIGARLGMSLRKLSGTYYERIRMFYVPVVGDVLALVPEGW